MPRQTLEYYHQLFAQRGIDPSQYSGANGQFLPLLPNLLGRQLSHDEMDYNLELLDEVVRNYRVMNSNGDTTALGASDVNKYLKFANVNGEYVWTMDTGTGGGAGGDVFLDSICTGWSAYDIVFTSSESLVPSAGEIVFTTGAFPENSDFGAIRVHKESKDGHDLTNFFEVLFEGKQLSMYWSDPTIQTITTSSSAGQHFDQCLSRLGEVTCDPYDAGQVLVRVLIRPLVLRRNLELDQV